MKFPYAATFLAILLFLSSCKDPNGPESPEAPIVAIFPAKGFLAMSDSARAPFDATKTPMTIDGLILPYNCPRSFFIVNVGPEGSMLGYRILDNGSLGGFLDFTNDTGTISAGSYVQVDVTVDPRFASDTTIAGQTNVLNVYTPKASNVVKTGVGFLIKSMNDEAQKLLGTWSGTWSMGPYVTAPANVGGTWTLDLEGIDFDRGAASGTLTWIGRDAYIDSAGQQDIYPNKIVTFNSTNATFQLHDYMTIPSRPCDGAFDLIINEEGNHGNCSAPYGPIIHLCLTTTSDNLGTAGSSNWGSHPGKCQYNRGDMVGRKTQ